MCFSGLPNEQQFDLQYGNLSGLPMATGAQYLTPGFVEDPVAGPSFDVLTTQVPGTTINITDAVQWYAYVLAQFFQSAKVFNKSVPISITLEPMDTFYPQNSIFLFNSSDSTNFTQPIGNVTFDPLEPGRLCQTYPMTVEQLPALFGLQESPEFCSILAAMFVAWYWVSVTDLGQTSD
jgi:hypothetical protein